MMVVKVLTVGLKIVFNIFVRHFELAVASSSTYLVGVFVQIAQSVKDIAGSLDLRLCNATSKEAESLEILKILSQPVQRCNRINVAVFSNETVQLVLGHNEVAIRIDGRK